MVVTNDEDMIFGFVSKSTCDLMYHLLGSGLANWWFGKVVKFG